MSKIMVIIWTEGIAIGGTCKVTMVVKYLFYNRPQKISTYFPSEHGKSKA